MKVRGRIGCVAVAAVLLGGCASGQTLARMGESTLGTVVVLGAGTVSVAADAIKGVADAALD